MTDSIKINPTDPAHVIAALHAGTKALGLGVMHDKGDLTPEQVREIFGDYLNGRRYKGRVEIFLDYVTGRPIKVSLLLDDDGLVVEVDRPDLYDRDAGPDACLSALAPFL